MSALTSNSKIYKNGDQSYIDLCYRYDGPGKKDNVVITITGLSTPGITIDNVDVTKGIIDVETGDWLLSTLIPGKDYCATVYFTIDDSCVLNDGIEFTLNDNCGCSPEICVTFTGIGCCAVAECVGGGEVEPIAVAEVVHYTSTWSTQTLDAGSIYFIVNASDSISKTVLLNLNPGEGDVVIIKDKKGDASVNTITIDGNGKLIDGASSIIINQDKASYSLVYDGVSWNII